MIQTQKGIIPPQKNLFLKKAQIMPSEVLEQK